MKYITILLFLISTFGYSQKVKHIVRHFPNSKIIAEEYYVLKSDKRTKHGEYTSYNKFPQKVQFNGVPYETRIKQHGFYVNGKKDGPWVETTASGREEKGNYSNGVRTGIWDTYYNHMLMGSFDYSLGRKIGTWHYFEGKQPVTHNYETGEVQIRPSAKFLISYPKKAREAGIQGTVTVQFRIAPDCTIKDITVIKSLSPECDEAVIQIVKDMEKQGFYQQENCNDKITTFSVNFQLTD